MLKLLVCSDAPEQALRYHGFQRIAGVDEVGRGALFGPVVAAAVILPECLDELAAAGLKDSKQLTREERETLDMQIRGMALAILHRRGRRRDDRPREHLPGVADGDAGGGAGLDDGARPSPDRCDAARPSMPADEADLWRRAEPFDCGGFGGGEGASRCA